MRRCKIKVFGWGGEWLCWAYLNYEFWLPSSGGNWELQSVSAEMTEMVALSLIIRHNYVFASAVTVAQGEKQHGRK